MNENANNERIEFSARLQNALRSVGLPTESPTRLSREFNARYTGEPITMHAARKWLIGEAIPTQEKIRVLAEWLGVTPEWLRFGAGVRETGAAAQEMDSSVLSLVTDIKRLPDRDQTVVREFVRTMVRLNAQGSRRL